MVRKASNSPRFGWRAAPNFGAIDLGTNHCGMMIAAPRRNGFRVIETHSRLVRLGEGLAQSGMLANDAMDRAIEHLAICADKLRQRDVVAVRCIATAACRSASNGLGFLQRVKDEAGLELEIATPDEEARLSVRGCEELIDPEAQAVLVFDIGGGSTELSWLRIEAGKHGRQTVTTAAWASLPVGVVTLADQHNDAEISAEKFQEMSLSVSQALSAVDVPADIRVLFKQRKSHLIGTSGTITTIAGVHLGLKKYSRKAVDGIWLTPGEISDVTARLCSSTFKDRVKQPCVGLGRADLIIPGCAILAGILTAWPMPRVRAGDRGLIEGIVIGLIEQWRRER